jgi:hypothetical protein
MTGQGNIDPHRRYFEIDMPASAEQYLALDGLATAFGWRMREIPGPSEVPAPSEIPGEEMLLKEDFERISEARWGESYYGAFAMSYVDYLRYAVQSQGALMMVDGIAELRTVGGHYRERDYSVTIGDHSLPMATILQRAEQAIEGCPLPFKLDTRPPTKSELDIYGPGMVYGVEPLLCSKDRLRRHIFHTGMDRNPFHGALGKAIDTLLIAADIKPPIREDEPEPSEFVPFNDAMAAMESAGVTKAQLITTRNNFAYDFEGQVQYVRAPDTGELIAEGDCTMPRIYMHGLRVDRVSLGSLESYAPHTASQRPNVGGALRNIREIYGEWKQAQPEQA